MISSVLVVCVGNICRSPAAEKLFQARLGEKIIVSSAGLGALVGRGIDQSMLDCLANNGVGDFKHSARQFTRELALSADLILVMEQGHQKAVQMMAPEASGKTMLLGKWSNNQPVADPYRHSQEFFNLVFEQIVGYVDEWVLRLQ